MFDWMVLEVINGKEYLARICWCKERAEEVAKELAEQNKDKTYKVVEQADNF
jgi:hypothetical protein